MKFFLATADNKPYSHAARDDFAAVAARCASLEISRAESPDEADFIVFSDTMQLGWDWKMALLRGHELVRKFPRKCFVYDECDAPRDALPGVYVSMPRAQFNAKRHRAFSYRILANEFSRDEAAFSQPPELLFSFQGRRVGEIRGAILDLKHPRARIEDTSATNFFGEQTAQVEQGKARYRQTLLASQFVLCPRGAGTSSIRLFETLGAGRVPVVLCDDFVFPEGIDWRSCSVQIPESNAAQIPAILERESENFEAKARAARRVYEENFAPEVWFLRLLEKCRELQELGELGVRKNFFFDPSLWRAGARDLKTKLRKAV